MDWKNCIDQQYRGRRYVRQVYISPFFYIEALLSQPTASFEITLIHNGPSSSNKVTHRTLAKQLE
jgi:hypothetical protein